MRSRPGHDPHLVLGVTPGASRAEIRRAYRRRAMATHPDVAGSNATADMAALNEARDELVARAGGSANASGSGPGDGSGPVATEPVVPDEPAWPPAQATVWPDYWSAWNDLPRRT
jgi:hypothetical protein